MATISPKATRPVCFGRLHIHVCLGDREAVRGCESSKELQLRRYREALFLLLL
jgi:hypothetical protein